MLSEQLPMVLHWCLCCSLVEWQSLFPTSIADLETSPVELVSTSLLQRQVTARFCPLRQDFERVAVQYKQKDVYTEMVSNGIDIIGREISASSSY